MGAEDRAALAEDIAERLRGTLSLETRPLLTTAEAGERLGVSERTVRQLVIDGELSKVIVSKDAVRFEPAELDRYIASRRTEGTA